MASGDDDIDREAEEWILAQLESGNDWAWCRVRVTARWKGFEGSDSLGACSYKSEADFCTEDGYFADMKQAALDELNEAVQDAAGKIDTL